MPFLRAALIQKKKAEEAEHVNILPPIVVVPEEPESEPVPEEIEILPEPEIDDTEAQAEAEFTTLLENAIQKVEAEEAEIFSEEEELEPETEILPEPEQLEQETEILTEPEQLEQETEILHEPEQLEQETEILHEPEQLEQETEILTEPEQVEQETEILPESEQVEQETEILPESEQVEQETEILTEPEQLEQETEILHEPEQDTDTPDDLGQVPQDSSDAFANLPAEILAAVTEDEPTPEPEPAQSTKDYSGETLNYDFTSGERYVDKISTKTEFDKMLDELSAISKDLLSREVEKFAVKFTSKFQGDFDKAESDARKYEAFLGGFITNAAMTLYDNGYKDSAVKQLEQAKGIIEASKRIEEETQAIRDRVEEEDATVDLSDILGLFGD